MPQPVRLGFAALCGAGFVYAAYDAWKKGRFKINGWSSVITIEKGASPLSFAIAVGLLGLCAIACLCGMIYLLANAQS